MGDSFSADTDDLDAFVALGSELQAPLRSTLETLIRQRNYLLGAGFPSVVGYSEFGNIDNSLHHMAELDGFVEVISESLKDFGRDLGNGVYAGSADRVRFRLDAAADTRLDELEEALQAEGLSEADARLIRDRAEVLLAADPRYELDGATFSEPDELAAAIVQAIDDRSDDLITNNQTTSSALHAQPVLSVSDLANDLHYGNNEDPLVPEALVVQALRDKLAEDQRSDLDSELELLERREQIANFSLVEGAADEPEIPEDFDAIVEQATALYDDNIVGPGIYGGEQRLNEAELAFQLQKAAEVDPGRAIVMKWVLDGLLTPDERAELDRILAGDSSLSERVGQATAHPVEGSQGVLKGTWNSTFGFLGDALADATVGITYGVFGLATGSNPTISPEVRATFPQAPETWEELDAIVELQFEMDNIAEEGGDDIALIIDIGSAVYGGAKGGLTLVRIGGRYFFRNGDTLIAAARRGAPFNDRGQITRFGDRIVIRQTGPTCGPNSCAMALDTVGQSVDDLPGFVAAFPVGDDGITLPRMARTLAELGYDSTRYRHLTVEQIATLTRGGNPMVVAVRHPGPGGPGHAIVVDGITTRYGKQVVAIRDPHGRQYFEDLAVFEERFLNQGLLFEG